MGDVATADPGTCGTAEDAGALEQMWLRGFSSHQSASRVAQIAHPGVDAFQVVRCRKISGDDLLKKSRDNEADS